MEFDSEKLFEVNLSNLEESAAMLPKLFFYYSELYLQKKLEMNKRKLELEFEQSKVYLESRSDRTEKECERLVKTDSNIRNLKLDFVQLQNETEKFFLLCELIKIKKDLLVSLINLKREEVRNARS